MATNLSTLPEVRVRISGRGDVASQARPALELGLSPRTFAAIRWTQVLGQLATIVVAAFLLDVDLPLVSLLALVGIGAASTMWATRQLKPPHRLNESQLGSILLLDAAQIGALLALTGALSNPFVLFLLFPAVLGATTLGWAWCAVVCGMVLFVAGLLAFVPAEVTPLVAALYPANVYLVGTWVALTVGTVLIATYAWRIAQEGRRMGRALAATQLALEREQRLSQLDGLATAAAHDLGSPLSTIAILARDIVQAVPAESKLAEDARLLHQQARRCRDILSRFTEDGPLRAASSGTSVPLSWILERLCAEHQDRPIDVHLRTSVAADAIEPMLPPAGEVRHGLANLLDNAVTYARSSVGVSLRVDADETIVRIVDDGPGFPPEVLHKVGEPFVSTRGTGTTHGLGLFIACTFLTRASAELEFVNEADGAAVTVRWPNGGGEGNG